MGFLLPFSFVRPTEHAGRKSGSRAREREREGRRGLSLKGKEWDGGRKEGERR